MLQIYKVVPLNYNARMITTKAAIRHSLLTEHNNGDLAPLSMVQDLLDDEELVPQLTNFIAAFPSFTKKLFNVHGHVPEFGSGIGRGEVLIYFLYDSVTLGGTTSSVDVHIAGVPYLEVKAAKKRGSVWVDFRLGTDEFTASHHFLLRVVQLLLKNESKGLQVPENFGNISGSLLAELRRVSSRAMQVAEEEYFNRLFAGRVGSKKFLIFDIDTNLPVYYGKLERDQLQLERFSSGQTKLIFSPIGFSG